MITRDIYSDLLNHSKKKQVTVITGMRRVGKSTAVKYILQQLEHNNYLYLDCERIEIRILFNGSNYENIKNELELMGLDLSKPSIIALDEIQLVENLPSVIKYLYDTYNIKFIVTGCSSYYMKNQFSESLAGRKRIFEMYPLSFKEFLQFKNVTVSDYSKYAWKSFDKAWYNKFKDYYQEYIRFGGFPEVVLEDNEQDKIELLKDIINSYIELDVKLLSDYSISEDLYNLIKLLASRAGNKVTKLYFADTGILNILAGEQLSGGQIFENAIAIQLKTQGSIQYYQKKSGQEIDFIFNGDTALEVKETPIQQDKQAVEQRALAINIDKHFVIGRNLSNSGFSDFIWAGNIF